MFLCSYVNLYVLFYSNLGDLATLAAARSPDGSPEVLPKSWENFERVHNTQKRMPKLVYNQLKKGKKDSLWSILVIFCGMGLQKSTFSLIHGTLSDGGC